MKSRIHGDERLVVEGQQRAQRNVVGRIPKWIFQFARHLVQSRQTRDRQKRERGPQPNLVGVLVHQERDGDHHHQDEERRELRVRKREGREHDLPRVVVVQYPVAEKLHDAADDRGAHLPHAPGHVFPNYEVAEPAPYQLRFGVRTACALEEGDFVVAHSPQNEHGTGGVVDGTGVFGLVYSEEVADVAREASVMVGLHFDIFGELVGVGDGPRLAGDVGIEGGFDIVQIVAEGGQRHGAEERREVRQFLQE
mmetsp:Transcript_29840/g.54840  ORF Transcript_29840/g.54840 Transcript_29840/m.54840 type:complete len:252 (+) Transcript_29840:834-1589(+)